MTRRAIFIWATIAYVIISMCAFTVFMIGRNRYTKEAIRRATEEYSEIIIHCLEIENPIEGGDIAASVEK